MEKKKKRFFEQGLNKHQREQRQQQQWQQASILSLLRYIIFIIVSIPHLSCRSGARFNKNFYGKKRIYQFSRERENRTKIYQT